MHTSLAMLTGLLPLIGESMASPMDHALLEPRQGTIQWTSGAEGGNLQVFFSDEKIEFGTLNPTDSKSNPVLFKLIS